MRRGWRRCGASLLVAGLVAATGCTRAELPDAQDVRDIDLTPSAELVLVDDGRPLEVRLRAKAVLLIRNDDDEPHRLRADDFDTGLLEPGDEQLVTFPTPTTVAFTDHLGDLTGTITVTVLP